MPRGSKPGERRGGRDKGTPNKFTKTTKEEVLETMAHLKSKGMGLSTCAEEDPKWFYQNFLKTMLPKEIDVTQSGTVNVIIKEFGYISSE